MKTTPTIQLRLSMDKGLENIWKYLTRQYEGLDKASIIRLALNTLAKETKKTEYATLTDIMNEADNIADNSMSEDEVFTWWNDNKSSLV